MKKITNKTARTCACMMLAASLACAFTALRAGDAYADGTTLSTSALLMNAGEETVVSAKNVTLTNDKTDTVTGLSVAHADATQPWSVDINATFSGDSSFTYFLPNQYGSNSQWVANAFTVKNSEGKAVAVFVNANSHWSLLTTGRAYMYDPVQNVYTTARTYYNQTSKVNEYNPTKAPVALTPQKPTLEVPNTQTGGMKEASATLQMPLSGFGDQMYIAPKIGTQVNLESKTLTGDITGTVYFDYDETAKTLAVKTTTYNVGNSTTDNQVGKGQTITLGMVSADLSAGYTVSMGSAPAVNVDGTAYSYPYSSSIILTSIDGVDVKGETVACAANPQTITYGGEKVIGGKNTISLPKGEELDEFTVSGNFIIGGKIASASSAELYKITATETFADKAVGEYTLNVTAGNVQKAYTVLVKKLYEKPSVSALRSVENVTFTEKQVCGTDTAILISRENANDTSYAAALNGVFTGSLSVAYKPSGVHRYDGLKAVGATEKDPLMSSAYGVRIRNAKGEEVLTVVSYYGSNGWLGQGGRTFVYNPNASNGNYYSIPTLKGMVSYETVADMKANNKLATALYGNYNTLEDVHFGWQSYYTVKTIATEVFFDYDEVGKQMTVRVNTPQKLSGYHLDANEQVDRIYTADEITNDPEYVTAGVISADLSAGYTVEFVDCYDDTEFVLNTQNIYLFEANGVELSGANVSVTAGNVVGLSMLGNTYTFDEADETLPNVYAVQNGATGTLSAAAYIQYKKNWTEYINVNEVTLSGEYNLATVGSYSVALNGSKDGIPFTKAINLIVEAAKEIAFDVDGGKAVPSIYISKHCYNFQLPTPVRYGWQFLGWYDGETKVTEITADMDSVTLKAKWLDDVAPTVALNDLEYYTIVDKRANFSISAADVIAEDQAWGLLGAQYINIFVKAPQATEYVPLQSFVFDGVTGEYFVRYEVTDGSGNTAQISRVVKYMPTRPVLTVNGEVPQTGYVGVALTLPTATAVSGDTPLNVTVSLVRNGQSVALTNNAFVPQTAGEYFLSYAVTDDNGLTAQQSFTVQVYADAAAPVITVDTTGITLDDDGVLVLELGATLVPPTATAIDSVSGSLTVSVEVRKGTQTIATGETVLSEAGVYTVVYTAIDGAGNMATAVLEVLVKPEPQPQPPIQPEEKGCGGTVTFGALIGLTTALGAAMYLKKRKNK